MINETLPDNFVVQIEGTTRIVDLNDEGYRSAIIPDLYITKPDPIRAVQGAHKLVGGQGATFGFKVAPLGANGRKIHETTLFDGTAV